MRKEMILKKIVPAAAIISVLFLSLFAGERRYYIMSLVLLILAMLPFFIRFERRRPRARELVLISLLAALAIAGRAAFYMLPQFKPSAAIIILAGAMLGHEAGFLTGILTGLVSNFIFGQGPWTPWQMFSFGLLGFLAGLIFKNGRPARLPLCVYGGLSVLLVYGGLMDLASVLIFQGYLSPETVITAYIAGVWFNLTHAAATVVFLALLAGPMEKKLARMRTKYGILE